MYLVIRLSSGEVVKAQATRQSAPMLLRQLLEVARVQLIRADIDTSAKYLVDEVVTVDTRDIRFISVVLGDDDDTRDEKR